jgi:hypothetical protein
MLTGPRVSALIRQTSRELKHTSVEKAEQIEKNDQRQNVKVDFANQNSFPLLIEDRVLRQALIDPSRR